MHTRLLNWVSPRSVDPAIPAVLGVGLSSSTLTFNVHHTHSTSTTNVFNVHHYALKLPSSTSTLTNMRPFSVVTALALTLPSIATALDIQGVFSALDIGAHLTGSASYKDCGGFCTGALKCFWADLERLRSPLGSHSNRISRVLSRPTQAWRGPHRQGQSNCY